MRADGQGWGSVLRQGLIWGGVAVFLAMVGMVEAFAERQVIVGVISLGLTLLALVGVAAGYQAAQGPSGGGLGTSLLRGALAGTVAGAALTGLLLLGSLLNLRTMFVSGSPRLFSLLSFGQGLPGWYLPFLAGSALGLIGAAATRLTGGARRPILTGLTWVLTVGVFQELLQIMLGTGGVRSAIREALFSGDGLSSQGALITFVVAWASSAVWTRRRAAARQWFAGRTASQQRGLRLIALGVAVSLLLLLPHLAGAFLSQVLVLVGLFALLGLGLNIVVGFAGLLDLGYVAFFAMGAYALGLLTSTGEHGIFQLSFWTAVPIAMLVSMIGGVLLGIPVLGIRGDYLAIATMGFGEIIRLLVLSDFLRPWLGGSQGVLAIPKPIIFGVELGGPEQLFYLTLVMCALVVFVASRLRDSRLGRAWMAVREDEDVAEAMGINLVNVKLLAFGLGAAFGGLSGAIFAVMVGSVFPHSFQLLISINVLSLIIVGGMGSLPGVVVGSLALVGLPELLREFADFRFLVYGAALVAMMQLRPEGLWPEAVRRRELHEDEPEAVGPEAEEKVLAAARERAGG